MTRHHTPARRDRYKAVTATVTGAVAFGAITGTGYAAGAMSRDHAEQQAAESEAAPGTSESATQPAPDASAGVRTVLKRRPHRTVVRTEVVHRVSTGVTGVGTGGSLSYQAPVSSGSSSGGSTRPVQQPAPRQPAPRQPAPRPAAAAQPAPKPAPSTGS